MQFQKKVHTLVVTICLLSASPFSTFAQSKSDKDESKLTGTPVLWKAPVDLPARDLFLGPGGDEMKPDLSHVTFESVRERINELAEIHSDGPLAEGEK